MSVFWWHVLGWRARRDAVEQCALRSQRRAGVALHRSLLVMAAGLDGELCEGALAGCGGAGGWFYWLMAMLGPANAVPMQFLAGRAAAAGLAAMNTITMFTGFVGPYWMGVMKDYTGSYEAGLRVLALPCLLAAGVDVCVDAKPGPEAGRSLAAGPSRPRDRLLERRQASKIVVVKKMLRKFVSCRLNC